MGIRMVRQPSAVYTAKKDSNYYAEDDVNLTTSLGVLSSDTNAYLVNLVYGKVILNNIEYLVSIEDMEMKSDMKNYNSVSNIDDIIPFRYAYGDQNGFVIRKGSEVSHTIDGLNFRVNSGRIVLQGVETDIDANGVVFTIDRAIETRYFVVYYEVNLATQTTSIKLSNYSTSGYPIIDSGDDLTTNPSGVARLELYRFTAINGIISNVEKLAKPIKFNSLYNLLYNDDDATKINIDLSNYIDNYEFFLVEVIAKAHKVSNGETIGQSFNSLNKIIMKGQKLTEVGYVTVTDTEIVPISLELSTNGILKSTPIIFKMIGDMQDSYTYDFYIKKVYGIANER